MAKDLLKKYHFIGIGGIGMSGLARILLDKNLPVSGSDLSLSETTEQLVQRGATIYQGHSVAHISPEDTVVFNSQIAKNNPEYLAALALKCPILHRSELLTHLMKNLHTVVVAGTHGKTTTSSLLTAVLMQAEFDPTFALGGLISGINGRLGKGEYFIAEADESDGSFLNYQPEGAILTNVEKEHLDFYQNEETLKRAFHTFIGKVQKQQWLFYCGDDSTLLQLAEGRGVSYGFGEHNQLQISHYVQKEWHSFFDLSFEGKHYKQIQLALIGEHNALNAAAVFGLALRLKISEQQIRKALAHFPGVSRRCEKRGEKGAVLFLDDYGHHPTEIYLTLRSIKRAAGERRLVVLFQPHRYTRLRDCMDQFATAFEYADQLYVTDVYAASEAPIEGIDAAALIEKISACANVPCSYLPQERWCEEIKKSLQPHDLFLTLGAGDVTHLHPTLIQEFSPKKLRLGLIFGGRSCEHEISLRSSRFVADSLNRELYDLQFFGIDKEGKWVIGEEAEALLHAQPVVASDNAFPLLHPRITSALEECDLFLPIVHGTYGEDGTLQGFFEILDKPYAGPDYRSAAICMDKALTKRLVEKNGVKTPKDLTFGHHSWLHEREKCVEQIKTGLSLPLYIKPIHLGSSVGISYVAAWEKVAEAIDFAFRFDTQILVEEGKVGCRELEFAVLGNCHSFPIAVPTPGEKLAEGSFVDYEKKYGVSSALQTTIEPEMSADLLEKGKLMAQKAYEAIGCTGMTRVDFFLDPAGEFWLFEMNPIPGLQQRSLFPKIWNREGLPAEKLFDRLIILALERYRKQKRHYRCLK